MADGFFINTYEDLARDDAFINSFEIQTGSAGLLSIDLDKELRTDDDIHKRLKDKIDYQYEFNTWLKNEYNGQELQVRQFIEKINDRLAPKSSGKSSRSHSENSVDYLDENQESSEDKEDSDPGQLDSKFLIRKLTLEGGEINLYKRAMEMEVSNFADVVLTEKQVLADQANSEGSEQGEDIGCDFWKDLPPELGKDDTAPAQMLSLQEHNLFKTQNATASDQKTKQNQNPDQNPAEWSTYEESDLQHKINKIKQNFEDQDRKAHPVIEPVLIGKGAKGGGLIGLGRIPTPNRNFYRQLDATKLYTQKYVDQIQLSSDSGMKRFLNMAKYMMKKTQRETMRRARKLISETQDKFITEFETEAKVMIEQHREFKTIIVKKTQQIEQLIQVIGSLELDLSLMRQSHDYVEEFVGLSRLKTNKDGDELKLSAIAQIQQFQFERQRLVKECQVPVSVKTSGIQLDFISLDERISDVTQNINRFRDGIYDFDKEIDFTRKPFHFYGAYVRINEDQKYKYAETKVVKYYKSLIQQIVSVNSASEANCSLLQNINNRLQNELDKTKYELEQAILAKFKAEDDLQKMIKLKDLKIAEVIAEAQADRRYLTEKYMEEMTIVKMELQLQNHIVKQSTAENIQLKSDIASLKEMLVIQRHHFKTIETSNFDALKERLQAYKDQLDSLGITPEDMLKHKARMATLKLEENQIETETQKIILEALKRGIKLDDNAKANLKYKIVSHKMTDIVQTRAAESTFDKTQTSWVSTVPDQHNQIITEQNENDGHGSVLEQTRAKLSAVKENLAKTLTDFSTYRQLDKIGQALTLAEKKSKKTQNRQQTLQNDKVSNIGGLQVIKSSFQKVESSIDMDDFKGVLAGELGQRRASEFSRKKQIQEDVSIFTNTQQSGMTKFLPKLDVRAVKPQAKDQRSQSVTPKLRFVSKQQSDTPKLSHDLNEVLSQTNIIISKGNSKKKNNVLPQFKQQHKIVVADRQLEFQDDQGGASTNSLQIIKTP